MSAQVCFQKMVELNKEEVSLFYSGNVIMKQGYRGFCVLAYHGHILGFGKGDGVMIKNKLPKGLQCKIEEDLFK